VKLSNISIRPNPWLNNSFIIQPSQTTFNIQFASIIIIDSNCLHASKEYFENWFHIIYKHFLKVFLLGGECWILLVVPHLEYDTLIYVPVLNVRFEILKGLWFFLIVLGHPISRWKWLFLFEFFLHRCVYLIQKLGINDSFFVCTLNFLFFTSMSDIYILYIRRMPLSPCFFTQAWQLGSQMCKLFNFILLEVSNEFPKLMISWYIWIIKCFTSLRLLSLVSFIFFFILLSATSHHWLGLTWLCLTPLIFHLFVTL